MINSSSLTSLFPPLAMLLRLKTEPVMLPRNQKSIKNIDLSQEESCSGLSLLSEERWRILVISDWGGKWERSFEKGEKNKQTKNKMTLRIKYFYIFFADWWEVAGIYLQEGTSCGQARKCQKKMASPTEITPIWLGVKLTCLMGSEWPMNTCNTHVHRFSSY